ncbi:MAG: hypothetical protein J6X58_03650 [Bacteroidales bacterium]|nr:hypothetical protein [Bacteroidales bacterium]
MKSFRIICIAVIAVLIAAVFPQNTNAQSNIMYGSSRNPHMNAANPAFFPSNSNGYVTFPSFNFNLSSPLAFSDIFQYDSTSDKTIINATNILDLMSDKQFRFGTNIHPFGFGLNFKKFFITISSQAKVDVGFGLPNGLATFLNEGNYNHTGDDVIELLDGNLIGARVYGEGALGFGYRINDNITVGGRLKMLVGYADLSNSGSSLTIRTEPDYSAITANLDINMNFTSIMDIHYDSTTDETTTNIRTFLPKNYGFAMDLGGRYETDLFEVSASIIDVGPGIHWQDGLNKIVSARENNSFTFSGVDVSNMMQGGQMDTTFTQMLIDSLKTLTDFKTIEGGSDYWTSLPTKFNVGGMYHIVKDILSAGILFHGEIERGWVKEGLEYKMKNVGFYSRTSAIVRAGFRDWIEVVASNSVVTNNGNVDWFNPGFGVTLTPFRTLQFYGFMDYISNIYLVDAKRINISFGLNILFGKNED